MAYDTYADLKTAVATRLIRTDLSALVPDFIKEAEQEINARLHVFPQEVEASLAITAGARLFALPADFGQPIGLYLTDVNPRQQVSYCVPEQMAVDTACKQRPSLWAVDGANVALQALADQNYTAVLRYEQAIYLSDAVQTHATFKRYPAMYLWGALAQAAPYMRDDARWPAWDAKFKSLLRLNAHDASRARAAAPLRTELAGLIGRCR
jgi:hypothetical protein